MKKIKQWLINHFLPMWAKETVLQDNKRLIKEIEELRQQLVERNAYISGLETGIRAQRRITINNGEWKK